MAKKKLFGNTKEPRCETCAHGKLSANGESVLCIQGGALPLDHSCRRYQYDPLRRMPKRRPLLESYSAADFALDDVTVPAEPVADEPETVQEAAAVVPTEEAAVEETVVIAKIAEVETEVIEEDVVAEEPATDVIEEEAAVEEIETEVIGEEPEATAEETSASSTAVNRDRLTIEHLFEYLNSHDTPDAETILAILNKEPSVIEELLEESASKEHAAQAQAALAPDDSLGIEHDLERLNMETVPTFAKAPLPDVAPDALVFFPSDTTEDAPTLAESVRETQAPLSVNDLLFLPRGTRSDHEEADDVGGGFMPLTGNE